MLRIGEIRYLCDNGGDVGFIARIEPVTATLAAICTNDDTAGLIIIGQSMIQEVGIQHLCHITGKLYAFMVAVECTFV